MDNISNVHTSIVETANELVGDSIYACKVTIPIILIVILTYTTVSSLILGEQLKLDYKPLLRGILLMFVVVFYVEIMGVISLMIAGFNGIFERPNDLMEAFQDFAEAGTSSSADPNANDGFWDTISNTWDEFFSITHLLIGFIQEGITFAVRGLISLVRSILLGFLYLVGPIAITLSMVPGFRNSGIAWLKGFIGVQFWDLTLNILDNLIFAYHVNGFSRDGMDVGYGLVVNVVIVIMYLMTPGLTNYFVNTGSASHFWGRLGGMAASALFFTGLIRNGSALRRTAASQAVDNNSQRQTTPQLSTKNE